MWVIVRVKERVFLVERNQSRGIKCYIGIQLITSEYTVFGFIPPQNVKVSQVFQKMLLETGLYNYLEGELLAREHTRRVQDLVKVITKSRILSEQTEEEKAAVLTLHGKIRIIFLIWLMLSTLSYMAFGFEILGDKRFPLSGRSMVVKMLIEI